MAGVTQKYGLLRYRRTENLGDEIQSIAARQFLPSVDRMLDRDQLDSPGLLCPPLKLIMNGWFTHSPLNWPPHPAIQPLLLSFHLSDQMTASGFSAAEALVVGESGAWLREHGPVGARDLWTLDLLRRNNIDAWFSGCLTLTLRSPAIVATQDYVVLNDLSDDVAAIASQQTASAIVKSTHLEAETHSSRRRFAMAERLLRLYAQARCVITSRLHCALPCLAMGVPVLLVLPERASKRFSGLSNLVHTCCASEFLQGRIAFDLKNPPANPKTFLPLRERLVEQCKAFTGEPYI